MSSPGHSLSRSRPNDGSKKRFASLCPGKRGARNFAPECSGSRLPPEARFQIPENRARQNYSTSQFNIG